MKLLLVIAFSFILSQRFYSSAANNNVPTVATDFVFTFFNADVGYGNLMLVIVSNNNNDVANVNVTSSYPSFSTIRVSIASYSVITIPITPQTIQNQWPGFNMSNDGQIIVENKGIRLQSDLPVSVYADTEDKGGASADSFLVLPAMHLGTRYAAVTSTNPYDPFPNMISVIAYQDNTKVTIGLRTVTLNALQTASVASHSILSGTTLTGNKPFAAISGCTLGRTTGFGDFEVVMLLPVGAWGTQFVAIPFMFTSSNNYQVVANTDNTVLSVGSKQIAILNAGQYREFASGVALITSNHPIQLIQEGMSAGFSQLYRGDPFFLQVPSTDKWSNMPVLFHPTGFIQRPLDEIIYDHFIRIVTNVAGTGQITLDGRTIDALQYKRVPNSGFYYYEEMVLNATHSVKTTASSSGTKFSIFSYSYGDNAGLGFACGFSLPILNPAASTKNY